MASAVSECGPSAAAPAEPPSTPALTLDQAINLCLLADPRIRAGLESINQSHADALTAALKPNPDLAADIQLLPLTRPFTVTEQGGPPQFDVQIAYPIDWFLFGKQAAALVSAGLGVRVAEAEYADLVRRRVMEVALAFFDVLENRALRELARQELENLRYVEAVARKGVEAGERTMVELNRVRLDLLSSQRELRNAEAALVASRARLRALLGRCDADPGFDVAGTLDAPLAADPPPVEEAYRLAIQHRPDLAARRWKVSQARANVTVEERRAYPTIKPFLGYTRQFQRSIGFPDANSWSAWVEMSLPFCNRNQGNRAKAASQAVQSQLELETGLIELRAEIETVVEELRAARANAELIVPEQLRLAEQVRDAVEKAYRKGEQTLLDVLDARRNYHETYRGYLTARATYWRALYKFNAAVGKQVIR
ncbi:MAG TPA: TolC family protein [Gemmataceae bacterium]|nr:TolC family protein [Gemmataceae bacterium]